MSETSDARDLEILAQLQDTLEVTSRPFLALSEKTGLTEEEVTERIRRMKKEGIIRRVGAVLRHRKAGYTHNVLTAWTVTCADGEDERQALDRVGETLAASSHISHCYARKSPPGWKWPVFAMVHTTGEEEMEQVLSELKSALPGEDVRILKTVKEWKKTSMRYFT